MVCPPPSPSAQVKEDNPTQVPEDATTNAQAPVHIRQLFLDIQCPIICQLLDHSFKLPDATATTTVAPTDTEPCWLTPKAVRTSPDYSA